MVAGTPFRFSLAEALKKGPVVLYFYPKAFTQGCTIEANRFAEAHDGRIAYAYSSMSPDLHVPNTLDAVRRWSAAQRRSLRRSHRPARP